MTLQTESLDRFSPRRKGINKLNPDGGTTGQKNDPLKTVTKRVEIGFPGTPDEWREAEAHYTEHTLEILGQPVMEDWETPYMDHLADIVTRNGGTILEIGFGMGISSRAIHKLRSVRRPRIDRHIIIEANRQVADKAREFYRNAQYLTEALVGFWHERIAEIPDESVDGTLYDGYPLASDEIHRDHLPFFEHAFRILKPGGILTFYSDQPRSFSDDQVAYLTRAGFQESKMQAIIVPVLPPPDCKYWQYNTIMAPVVIK